MTHMTKRALLTAAITATAVAAIAAPASAHQPARTDAVATWNENMGKAAVAACISPVGPSPAEARLYAMAHVAIHDALNAIDRRSEPYAYYGADPAPRVCRRRGRRGGPRRARPCPGSARGPRRSGVLDAAVDSVEADYAEALGAIRDGRAKRRGIAVGQAAAAAILALRADDECRSARPGLRLRAGHAPGDLPLHPGSRSPSLRCWARCHTFVLRNGAQFRPGPPHAVTDPRYTADYNEIKRLGGDGVTTPSARTADETEIAMFWYESSPLQWNRIARTVARAPARRVGAGAPVRPAQHGPDRRLHRDVRDQVPVQLLAPGHRDPARRVDGNPATAGDPAWTPLMPTPDDPRL